MAWRRYIPYSVSTRDCKNGNSSLGCLIHCVRSASTWHFSRTDLGSSAYGMRLLPPVLSHNTPRKEAWEFQEEEDKPPFEGTSRVVFSRPRLGGQKWRRVMHYGGTEDSSGRQSISSLLIIRQMTVVSRESRRNDKHEVEITRGKKTLCLAFRISERNSILKQSACKYCMRTFSCGISLHFRKFNSKFCFYEVEL